MESNKSHLCLTLSDRNWKPKKNCRIFRADLLCRDTITDSYVLIENQLERTDHFHLGQLMTYAAGLETFNIIWVAQKFNEEHRAAIELVESTHV